ncbi:MAG: MFS transporter [Actinomycetia bacterium]|nr:MFS transporter [Actinomycetes bacterium]
MQNSRTTDPTGRTTIFINIIGFLACIVMQGMDVYLALYIQSVLGFSAMIAGLAVLPMSLSWLAVAYFCGKILLRLDGRTVVLAAGCWLVTSSALIVTTGLHTNLVLVSFFIFLLGFGLGGLMTATTVVIQESVGYEKRGTAIGVNSFIKSLGQTSGVTILGALLNWRLAAYFLQIGRPDIDTSTLFQNGGNSADVDGELLAQALHTGINLLFWIMLAIAGLLVLVVFWMPRIQLKKPVLD